VDIPEKPIHYYAGIAKDILEKDTQYLKDKNIIQHLFDSQESYHDSLVFRLTIIDSYYSTQMSKRFFGIEELADELLKVAKDDSALRSIVTEFIDHGKHRVLLENLFNKMYGYNKKGNQTHRAASLLSKYFYFLTDFNFPIYDNLVKDSFADIRRRYDLNLSKIPGDFKITFFDSMTELKAIAAVESFDTLDNFLWLYGKLRRGSFSLILPKDKYLALVAQIQFTSQASRDTDNEIRRFIQRGLKQHKPSLESLFADNTIEFMTFCYERKLATL